MKLSDLLSVLDSSTRIRVKLDPREYGEEFCFRDLEDSPMLQLEIRFVRVDYVRIDGIVIYLRRL